MGVVGWSNGSPTSSGAGYGIRIARIDRDKYFQREWLCVIVELGGEGWIRVNLSDSFWRSCIELRSAQIGRWMINQGLAPWPRCRPPELELEPIGNRRFRLRVI